MANVKTYGARHAGRGRARLLAAAIVVIMVVLAVYYSLGQGVPQVTQTQSFYLQSNQTSYFNIFGYLVAMKIVSSNNYSTAMYVSRVPILVGPVSSFSLTPGASVSVSSAGSQTADMNIKLISSGTKGATITITPLTASLSIATSNSISVLNPAALSAAGANANAMAVLTTTVAVTSATTTITSAPATSSQQALSIANSSATGTLMKKFKALYNSDSACSASMYSATYSLYYSALPTVPNDYANVSVLTPTDITVNASLISGSQYRVTYSTVSSSPYTTGPAAVLTVNTSSSSVSGVAFAGVFNRLSYATINSTYAFQSGVSNKACGAFISPH